MFVYKHMRQDPTIQKMKVYFIRHPDGHLDYIEKFLRQRDFMTQSSSDLKEAFTSIIKFQPQYIFVCMDHPSEKINAIPKLLLQSLPVTVIPYVNGTSMNSIRTIQTTSFEYKLFPPNSPPSVLRLLNKIIKEQAQGDKNKKEAGQIINASQPNSAESKFYHIEGSDSKAANITQSELDRASIEFNMNQTTSHQNHKAGGQEQATKNSGLFNPQDAAQANQNASYTVTSSQSAKGLGTPSPTAKSPVSTVMPSPNSANKMQPQIPTKRTSSVSTRKGQNRAQSNFEQGAEEVLNHITQGSLSDPYIQKVHKVSNATCFAIDSTRFTGYLVVAFAGKIKFDTQFLSLMKQRLKEFLLSRGEDFDPSEKMDVQIIEVEFESWAVEQAEFLKKSVHKGNELAMAFFPTQHPRLTILPSEGKDMLKVSIDDIDENRAVKFNLYIYLSVNKKYILYTPKGGHLKNEQKNRLKTKGVADVHFHKDEAHDFKTYQAEKYLNDKISELHSKEKDKTTDANAKSLPPVKKKAG